MNELELSLYFLDSYDFPFAIKFVICVFEKRRGSGYSQGPHCGV